MQNSLSCVKSNQETSRLCQQNAEKKSANDGESSGQQDGFLLLGKRINIPKKPRNILIRPVTGQRWHGSAWNSKKRERDDDESLSQPRGKGSLARFNGAIKTNVPSICTAYRFNFENQRSADKFEINQVWAIYSHDKGMMPRKYVQIKRIDPSSGFKLHVAPLELFRPLNIMTTHPVCGGHFKLKTGVADVLAHSSFSHQVKAVKIAANRYEVYPGEGEIWALYKNWNDKDCAETEEFDIVEVVDTLKKSIHVVPLTPIVIDKLIYGRSQETKAGFSDIPKTEASRFFSHQIPERSATWFEDGKHKWELDPKAVS
ncbi:unnamed protein product [Microthlaspi erraticum]|uniref:DUF3444 domain-containing protein n=1 Tax=Microthlaspi erraticum TaxID=1685480 RepID=A0A6D2JT74_9BRAS|nr:unnamed protein product [Microthlaspi erraticum]